MEAGRYFLYLTEGIASKVSLPYPPPPPDTDRPQMHHHDISSSSLTRDYSPQATPWGGIFAKMIAHLLLWDSMHQPHEAPDFPYLSHASLLDTAITRWNILLCFHFEGPSASRHFLELLYFLFISFLSFKHARITAPDITHHISFLRAFPLRFPTILISKPFQDAIW